MGTKVDKRMESIGEHYKGKILSNEQQAVIDVFSGNKDNQPLSVTRADGKRTIIMRQGTENKAGTKHSLFRHYETNSGVITAEDIALIPQIVQEGNIRKVKGGKGFEYVWNKDGVRYKVYTEIKDRQEIFCDFYSNKKGNDTRPSISNRDAQNGNTQSSARAESTVANHDANIRNIEDNPIINEENLYRTSEEIEAETEDIVKRAQANGTYLKAPNGKPTNLSPEQWAQVRTKSFKNWFGDWENQPEYASKVVDENGEPMVVYHGTRNGGFTVFQTPNKTRITKKTNAPDNTYWFVGTREKARTYSGQDKDIYAFNNEQYQSGIYPVFLNIRNPKIESFEGEYWDTRIHGNGTTNDVASEAFAENRDGVIIRDVIDEGEFSTWQDNEKNDTLPMYAEGATDFIVFSPRQIKSATVTVGSIDNGNEDLRYR